MLFHSPLGHQPLASTGRAERTTPVLQMNGTTVTALRGMESCSGSEHSEKQGATASPQHSNRQHPQWDHEAALTLSRDCISLHVQTFKYFLIDLFLKCTHI